MNLIIPEINRSSPPGLVNQNFGLDIPSQELRTLGLSHGSDVMQLPGITGELPFAGLPANANPWPDVYFVSAFLDF